MPKVDPSADLNATAASVLGFLTLVPMTGFDLMSMIENVIGDFWHVTKSQIYRELKLLAEQGLVETLAVGARDKQPYQITPAGRAAFRTWLRVSPSTPIVRMPIVLEVFFGSELPFAELRAHIEATRAHHAARLAMYDVFLPQSPPGTWSHEALRLGFMYQRVMLEWLDTLPKEALAATTFTANDSSASAPSAPSAPAASTPAAPAKKASAKAAGASATSNPRRPSRAKKPAETKRPTSRR